LPAIRLDDLQTALWAGMILGVVNLFIRPLLLLVMLPFNLITMGLLTIVINTWMIMLTDSLLEGLKIPGFWLTVLVSLIVSIINLILQDLMKRPKTSSLKGKDLKK
jgi:putative membrane protein